MKKLFFALGLLLLAIQTQAAGPAPFTTESTGHHPVRTITSWRCATVIFVVVLPNTGVGPVIVSGQICCTLTGSLSSPVICSLRNRNADGTLSAVISMADLDQESQTLFKKFPEQKDVTISNSEPVLVDDAKYRIKAGTYKVAENKALGKYFEVTLEPVR